MSLDELTGRRYGPVQVQIHPGQVGAYVAATGDDPDRWHSVAPPSFAGALLFAVAPAFLADPIVVREAGAILHGEQTFTWHRPLQIGKPLSVTGSVDRVRSRAGTTFVTFVMAVDDGEQLVDGRSTFVVSAQGAPPGVDGGEPEVGERGRNERPTLAPEERSTPLVKSASRADLVRYAGASHDWNPIHWDHASAVTVGLEGVIVHGLLSAAWVTQAVTRFVGGEHPVADARFRFRAPLRPAVQASIEVAESSPGRFTAALRSDAATHVTADMTVTP